jgi:hypothetical protein
MQFAVGEFEEMLDLLAAAIGRQTHHSPHLFQSPKM